MSDWNTRLARNVSDRYQGWGLPFQTWLLPFYSHRDITKSAKNEILLYSQLTNPIQQSLLDKLMVTQLRKVPASWILKVYYRVHKRPLPVPILSQINPIQTLQNRFLKINFNIIHATKYARFTLMNSVTRWFPLLKILPMYNPAFGDEPRRMLTVIQHFGKLCSCHLQGEYVNPSYGCISFYYGFFNPIIACVRWWNLDFTFLSQT
jgi:hypothetical protein